MQKIKHLLRSTAHSREREPSMVCKYINVDLSFFPVCDKILLLWPRGQFYDSPKCCHLSLFWQGLLWVANLSLSRLSVLNSLGVFINEPLDLLDEPQ